MAPAKGFTDRTSTVFTTMAGNTVTVNVTEGAGEWQHSYFYIDYGRDGEFDVDETKAIANGDLVTFNCYSVDGNTTWYNSLGEKQSSSHKNVVNGGLPSFTIPLISPPAYIAHASVWHGAMSTPVPRLTMSAPNRARLVSTSQSRFRATTTNRHAQSLWQATMTLSAQWPSPIPYQRATL